MTDEQIQNAKLLTPGLESLLRSVDLHESVLMAFRVDFGQRAICSSG